MTSESDDLDAVIERFSESEQALRSLMESIQGLTSAQQLLSSARGDLERSREESLQTLQAVREQLAATYDSAERSIGDASSGIYGLTVELKDISRDLKDTAIAWRLIGPGELKSSVDGLSAGIRRRENQMRIWLSILTVLVLVLGGLAIFV